VKQIVAVAVLAAAVACSSTKTDDRPPPTKRQVDSAIGESGLPGAQGVRGALAASDTMEARRKRADSIARADSGR
jgi:hypothetical protein